MKRLAISIVFLSIYSAHAMQIRLIQPEDLPGFLKVDRETTHEYFLPMVYKNYNGALEYDYLKQTLERELYYDDLIYAAKALCAKDDYQIHVAVDRDNEVVGYVLSQKKDTVLEIFWSIVYKEWRNSALEEHLIKAAIKEFDDITKCVSYPLQSNALAASILEKLGFVP